MNLVLFTLNSHLPITCENFIANYINLVGKPLKSRQNLAWISEMIWKHFNWAGWCTCNALNLSTGGKRFCCRPHFVVFRSIIDNGWDLSSPPRPDRLWDPPSQLSNGYQGFFPSVNRPGREAESFPANAEVKNT